MSKSKGYDSVQTPASSSRREPGRAEGEATYMLVVLTILASIGGLLFGYDTGIISGALVMLDHDFLLNDLDEELIVSLTVGGALVSAGAGGYFGDLWGRKPTVIISSILFTIGAVLMAAAANLNDLLVGRFIVGLGVGSASMIVPVYLAECAPPEHRGAMVTCMNVALTFGQLISCVIAGVFSTTPEGWRYMLGIAAVPAVVQFIGVALFLPESPRYLVQVGREEQGRRALESLRGTFDVGTELGDIVKAVHDEKEAIRRDLEREIEDARRLRAASLESTRSPITTPLPVNSTDRMLSEKSVGGEEVEEEDQDSDHYTASSALPREGSNRPDAKYRDTSTGSSDFNGEGKGTLQVSPLKLLQKKTNLRALILGCMVQFGNQFGGINTVMYYGASIFTLAGASHVVAIWLSIGLAGCNFTGSMIGFYLTDRLGRRPLTMASMTLVSISLLLIGLAFYCTRQVRQELSAQAAAHPDGSGEVAPALWVIFAAVCTYLICFASGMGCTPWTICSEIYPMSIRGAATSITTSANWAANFIMSMTFLTLTSALTKHGAFFLYSAVSFCFALFFYFYLPETRGVPLEETPLLFSDSMWGKQTGAYGRSSEPLPAHGAENGSGEGEETARLRGAGG